MTDPVAGVGACDSSADLRRPLVSPTWFHAHGAVWVPFSDVDNAALEERYSACRDELAERAAARERDAPPPDASGDLSGWFARTRWFAQPSTQSAVLPPAPPPPLPNVRKTPLDQHVLDPDEPASARQFRVPVLEDRLFDVDLERMIVYPALWPGFDQGVIRATWFYVSPDGSCSPIAWGSAVSDDLERAFDEARPWDLAPRLRATLQSTTKAKADAEPPPLYDLPSVVGGAKVMFDSAVSARVYTYVAAR